MEDSKNKTNELKKINDKADVPIMKVGEKSAYKIQYDNFGTNNPIDFNTNNINGNNFHMFATNKVRDPNGFLSEMRPFNRKLEFDKSLDNISETLKEESSQAGTLKNNFISNISKNNLNGLVKNFSLKNDSKIGSRAFSSAGPGQYNFVSFKDSEKKIQNGSGLRYKPKFPLNKFGHMKSISNEVQHEKRIDSQSDFESKKDTNSIQIQNNYTNIVINVNNQEEGDPNTTSGIITIFEI